VVAPELLYRLSTQTHHPVWLETPHRGRDLIVPRTVLRWRLPQALVVLHLDADQPAPSARCRMLDIDIERRAVGGVLRAAPTRRILERDPRDRRRTIRQYGVGTRALPSEVRLFTEREGIWICSWSCATALAVALWAGLFEVTLARRAADGRGEKM
jgi:hypothetical protein